MAASGGPDGWQAAEFVFGTPMAPADRLAGNWAALWMRGSDGPGALAAVAVARRVRFGFVTART